MSTQNVRRDHYERAMEDFLRRQSIPYLRVDEAKRSAFSGTKLKSFDLVVYPEHEYNILVDVKGRKWPYLSRGGKRYWENWVTREDLEDLTRWQGVFGDGYSYNVIRGKSPWLLDAGLATLRHETDRGWAGAVVETGALSKEETDAWLEAREADDAAVTIVGHEDLLALPPR